jgi:DNA polymerase V
MSSHQPPIQLERSPAEAAGRRPRASVVIGFGSPADDSGVTRLDLNDILIRHSQATFLMRVAGSSMRDAGIDDGDLVLVDRAIGALHDHVVIAVIDDGFVCRRLVMRRSEVRLRAADAAVADIVLCDGDGVQVWGVVTHAIKALPV